jgi:hypothetical protein
VHKRTAKKRRKVSVEMTEYTEQVENRRILMEAEKWGNGVKYLHMNKGITEIKYQNGDVHYEETKTGKKWKKYANHSQGTIVEKFRRWLADAR